MKIRAVVAGTGYDNQNGTNRADIIKKYCRDGVSVLLLREPQNKHDKNAISVLIEVPKFFGLFGSSKHQIGYIKSGAAARLAKLMDSGQQMKGTVISFHAPEWRENPRVTIEIDY